MNARLYSLFVVCGVAVTGCRSFQVTVTGSSATEQLLLAQAWDAALQLIDFQPLSGKKVFFDESKIKGNNMGWQIYRLRETMCRNGLLLQVKPEDADVIIEGGVAVYGSDATTTEFGLSGASNMTALAGIPHVGGSSAPLAECVDHYGAVRVALFAFDRRSRELIWQTGDLDGGSCTHITSDPFLPPRRTGTITTPAQLMGPRCRNVSPSWAGLQWRRASGCCNSVESACCRPETPAASRPGTSAASDRRSPRPKSASACPLATLPCAPATDSDPKPSPSYWPSGSQPRTRTLRARRQMPLSPGQSSALKGFGEETYDR